MFVYLGGVIGDLLCKFVMGGVLGWIGVVIFVFFLVVIVIECYFVVMFFYSLRGKLILVKVLIFVVVSWLFVFLWVGVGFFIIVYD